MEAPIFPSEEPVIEVSIDSKLDTIHQLESAGEYLEAQHQYESLLVDLESGSSDQSRVQEAYEDLNMKMLFSRFSMPGSEIYKDSAGDSLYKIAKKFNTTIDLIKKSNGLNKDTIYPDMKLKVISTPLTLRIPYCDRDGTLCS